MVNEGSPVYLNKNGYGTMVVMSLAQYSMLTDNIDMKLNEADKAAEESNVRYSGEEVFNRAKERINGK